MKKIVYLFLFLGPVCYLCKIPYLYRAWCSSPLDRWDWIAVPSALAAAVLAFRNTSVHLRQRPFTPYRLIPLGVALSVFALAEAVSVNSFALLSGAAVWWCFWFAALTPRFAVALLPAFLLLCLGCTSSTYWIGYFFSVPTWFVYALKGAAAAVILTLAALHIRIRIELCAFFLAFFCGLIAWYNADALSRTSEPLILAPEQVRNTCVMRRIPPDAAARRFFHSCVIRLYTLADDLNVYHLMEIGKAHDIHSIHPASHCLRSGGREIVSEKTTEIKVRGNLIPITLITAKRRNGKELCAVWYSCPYYSCSGFLAFRRRWNPAQDWRIYQLSVPVNGSESAAKKDLERMINALALRRDSRSCSF